ncbi:hypothetical protein CRG98_017873 [Punica granatum]|uniref:Uncharacterized protein n=1 Tax=Punica granatum TaxID=22663 RepID=A0A2I0JZM0_PUNGR|nr:hypothetical protein CRG98_017873 [Punica granatum]
MPTLQSAGLPEAQREIVGMNHTTHLDFRSSTLEVSDALFKSLEVISGEQCTRSRLLPSTPPRARARLRLSACDRCRERLEWISSTSVVIAN